MKFIVWFLIFLSSGIIFGYVSLAGIWFLLAAIINPGAYLPYAAGVGTFVTFMLAKAKQLKRYQKKGFDQIMRYLKDKMSGLVDGVLKKMMSNTSMLGIDPSQAANFLETGVELAKNPKLIEKQAINFINSTPVGKTIAKAGFDIEGAMNLARGDMSEIVKMARKKGIPEALTKVILAVLKKDFVELRAELKVLCSSYPQLHLEAYMIDVLMDLLFKPTRKSMENTVNVLAQEIFKVLVQKLEESGKIKSPHIKLISRYFPIIFEGMKKIREGSFDDFLDLLTNMNDQIYDLVKNKAEMALTKEEDKFKDQFSKAGVPSFALPKEIILILELIKIVVSAKQSIGINKTRIKMAVFKIAQEFFGIDRKILDFLSMILSDSIEKSQNMDMVILSKHDQAMVVRNFFDFLKFPQVGDLVILLYNLFVNNKQISDDQINALVNLFTKTIKLGISPAKAKAISTFAFGLYSLIRHKDIKKNLIKAAAKYGVDT